MCILCLRQHNLHMCKNTHFFGQPVFSQLLSFMDKSVLSKIKAKHQSDRYYKKFDTWQHLVTMLYCSFSGATSLRELSTGLLAWQNRLVHIGMPSSPKRSTISLLLIEIVQNLIKMKPLKYGSFGKVSHD